MSSEAARTAPKPFEFPELPDEELPVADLLTRREKQYEQKRKAKEARRLVRIGVKVHGPVGFAHFGDPHLDDDGCNIALLREHLDIVAKSDGMLAGCVGDYNNNWDGRLLKLWAEQSTSASEGWALVRWFIEQLPWLYLIRGNHDAWSGARDPITRLAAERELFYDNQARLAMVLPNKREVRLNARHDFRGHSMWNTAHGVGKAVQMGWRDHVAICGHLHTSGYMVLRDPMTRLISHAIRVASYKVFDKYAEAQGFPDQSISVCPITVVRPKFADDDPNFVTVFADPETGADFLAFLRKRKSE